MKISTLTFRFYGKIEKKKDFGSPKEFQFENSTQVLKKKKNYRKTI